MKLIVSAAAEEEAAAAASWYNELRPGLGAMFLQSFQDLLAKIERAPESFALVEGIAGPQIFRRGVLRRFPYTVIFRRDGEDRILVLAVAHTSRAPDYWTGRTS